MCNHSSIVSRINKPQQDVILASLKNDNMILTSFRIEFNSTNLFSPLSLTSSFKATFGL